MVNKNYALESGGNRSPRKREVVSVRMSALDKQKLLELAEKCQCSMSDWLVTQVRVSHRFYETQGKFD